MDLFFGLMFLACIPATIASLKGRNWFGWHVYGFWLFPIALVHSILMSNDSNKNTVGKTHYLCPYCQEPVKYEASVCPHCRRDVIEEEESEFSETSSSCKGGSKTKNCGPVVAASRLRTTRRTKSSQPRESMFAPIIFTTLILAAMGFGLWWDNQRTYETEQETATSNEGSSIEETRAQKINRLHKAAISIPAKDAQKNLEAYKELQALAPNNATFKAKVDFYQARAGEGQTNVVILGPKAIEAKWVGMGLKVEVPWRKSNFPTEDYTYISQCRGYVGKAGPSGFQTEITCEMLGHDKDSAHTVMVALEYWNPRFAVEGQGLAVQAMGAIGEEVPNGVAAAFLGGQNIKSGSWEVVDESTNKLKEIRVYFRSAGGTP